MAERLHLMPRLRQRLVTVPFNLGKPYWIEDPDFNLELHIDHVALPKPGGWAQLRKLASRSFSTPLDRTRALWEVIFVESLDSKIAFMQGKLKVDGDVNQAIALGAILPRTAQQIDARA